MKLFLRTLLATLALGLFALMPPTIASTPDGSTPAEETVCDVLQEDGVTKGLYGLCVAFCEAQDHAELSDPITQEELDALADSAPAGRILQNYNKKRDKAANGIDPEMPCIKVEEPCPCWTAEELAAIDGFDNVSGQTIGYHCPRLGNDPNTSRPFVVHDHEFNGPNTRSALADSYFDTRAPSRALCVYRFIGRDSDTGLFRDDFRSLSVGAGTLTETQAQACLAAQLEKCGF